MQPFLRFLFPGSRAGRFGLLVVFWGGVGLVLAGHSFVTSRVRGLPYPPSIALFGIGVGLSWVVLTPLVMYLARRFPLERGRWGRHLVLHLVAALLVDVAAVALLVLVVPPPPGVPVDGAAYFRQAFVNSFLSMFLLYELLYAAVVAVVHAQRYHHSAMEYLRKYREQDLRTAHLEKQLAHAQLQALRMQLNPHFLFNTLHAISSLMTQDVKAGRRMIAHLSDLLRLALDRAGENEVTVEEELDFLRHYLEIEETRFQDRLTVALDVAPATLRALVPNLLLQPIVENAVKHGIAPFDRGGTVTVAARRHVRDGHDRLVLSVADDGPGLSAAGASDRPGGIGLRNTRERLEQLYGDRFTFTLENRAEGGLCVTVEIPFHTALDTLSPSS